MPPSNRMRSASPRPQKSQNHVKNVSQARCRSSSRDDLPSLDKQWQDISSKNSQWRAKARSLSSIPIGNQTPRLLKAYLQAESNQYSLNQTWNEGFPNIFETSKQQLDHHTKSMNSSHAQPKVPKPFKAGIRCNEPSNEWIVHGTTNRLADEECSKSERMKRQAAPRSISPMRSYAASGQWRDHAVDNHHTKLDRVDIGTARGISKASSERPWATDILPGGGYGQTPKAIPMKAMSAHARNYNNEMVRVGSWAKTLRR
eukprot:gnl/MRDRNA2_/MRDRNA2_78210_c0_seq1.p1 gnl/MRDRNA2_/MRDRNA2_78210_c0~~gnl/MRDRNA2_/MRDRNA2_78210_c0_seq1.p1  ORF type:complete len:258 (-),score=28.54 gnl/MRDRNA2_/MRDRNA2_78210_c0_seq1:687-1460(-)